MNCKFLLSLSLIGLLFFASCKKDDDTTVIIDFGNAPAASIITSGAVQVITENTVRYHVVNFAGGSYTSTIVETENGVIVVDLGPAVPNFGTELRAYTDAIKKSISVIITHDHADHYGNISSFTDLTVYSPSNAAAALMADAGFTDVYAKTVVPVSTSQTISGLEFKFANVANAETGDNGYVYIPTVKALFSGDLVYNKGHNYIREYTPLDATDEISNWLAGLNSMKAAYGDYAHVFVGHNGVRNDVSATINENIAYLTDAQGLIKGTKALTAGGFAASNKEVTDELATLYPSYLTSGLLFALPDAFFPGDPGAIWF